MKDLKKQIGTRIRNRRIQMHFTQERLAELANVTPQTISSAERGTKELRIVNFYQICIALEVSSEYLLFGKTYHQINVHLSRRFLFCPPNIFNALKKSQKILLKLWKHPNI